MNVHDHSEQGAWDGVDELEARIDALFDRELSLADRRALAHDLRAHPRHARGVVTTRRMLEALACPVEAPDFEAEILAAVARRRRFIPESLRRVVTLGRLAAAIGFVALVTAIVLTRREVPELAFTRTPQPVTAVVDSTSAGAMEAVRGAADAVQAMQASPGKAVPRGFISTELRMTPPAIAFSEGDVGERSPEPPNAEFGRIAIARPSAIFVSSPEAVQAAFEQASAASPWFSSARFVHAGLGLPRRATTPWSP